MRIAIEQLQLKELQSFLREQADDTFPDLKDAERLRILSEKWHSLAEFCTCRNGDGHLVGMIAFYANQPESKEAFIPHVYVSSNYRRQGLFSLMLKKVMSVTQDRQFESIKLEVKKTNHAAQQSYLKNGFFFEKLDNCDRNSFFMSKPVF